MDYEINPFVGVGPIRFGMSSENVRRALGNDVKLVEKSGSGIPTEFYRLLGIFVYYKEPGVCEAVEFSGPVSPAYEGQQFLGRPYDEMEYWVVTIDPLAVSHDAGLTSNKLGMGLYAPSARKEPGLPVEGVIVFVRGYYG